jgi:hypothetical protein
MRHDVQPAKSVLQQTHFDGHVVHVKHLVAGGKKDYQPELALAGVQSADWNHCSSSRKMVLS